MFALCGRPPFPVRCISEEAPVPKLLLEMDCWQQLFLDGDAVVGAPEDRRGPMAAIITEMLILALLRTWNSLEQGSASNVCHGCSRWLISLRWLGQLCPAWVKSRAPLPMCFPNRDNSASLPHRSVGRISWLMPAWHFQVLSLQYHGPS